MSKNTVLITSAVYSNYGIYNPQERIKQTLETAISARKYIPNAVIFLIDNSKIDVQQDESEEFNALLDAVDYYIDNSNDADIQYFHNNVTNYDIGKNCMEAIGLLKSLSHIASDPNLMSEITSSNRIFKLSGRYVVTDTFDINKHTSDDAKDKYAFAKAQFSWIPEADTGTNRLLQTRLYSFPPSLYINTMELFQKILNNMFDLLNQQKYIDVEHSMAKFIDPSMILELPKMGVSGQIAPNGAKVEE